MKSTCASLSRMRQPLRGQTHVVLHGKLQNFAKCVDRILTSDWIALQVSYMVVCCKQNLYGVVRNCLRFENLQKTGMNGLSHSFGMPAGDSGAYSSSIFARCGDGKKERSATRCFNESRARDLYASYLRSADNLRSCSHPLFMQ